MFQQPRQWPSKLWRNWIQAGGPRGRQVQALSASQGKWHLGTLHYAFCVARYACIPALSQFGFSSDLQFTAEHGTLSLIVSNVSVTVMQSVLNACQAQGSACFTHDQLAIPAWGHAIEASAQSPITLCRPP